MKIVTAYRGIIKNSGFSLIELTISMGILMVLIGILTTLFGQILDVQIESKATSNVDQNGRFIMTRLTHDLKSASVIVTPDDPGDQTDTLQITVNSVNYIYTLDSDGNLLLTQNGVSNKLNSESVTVSGLSFTRIGNDDVNDTIRLAFTVTSKMQQANRAEEKDFQTTLGRN
jgi:type II secretory pathway pseudopilin PulG